MFELNFYKDQNKWRLKLIPIEVSKNDSDRVIDLLIYKNHFARIKTLIVLLGLHHKTFICRTYLNSYKSENMLKIHKPKCEKIDITTIRTSNESSLQWKKLYHNNPLLFRIYADVEVDNEIDNSSIGNKTTNTPKQKPKLNGYNIVSELEDVLKNG